MPLAYRGLGELFVVLFFGLVAVTGSAFVQSGHWHFEAIIAGLQIGMLSTVLIAINNLRDIEEDTRSGKRTLAVRFGIGFARKEIGMLGAAATALWLYWIVFGFGGRPTADGVVCGIIGACTTAVPSAMLWRAVSIREPSSAFNGLLAQAGANLLFLSGILALLFAVLPR
jgi:1,4-dihydroxy-2-naphthoate octaprenyltransferase